MQVLDVAISGSTPAAEAGTLVFFAGGRPELFQAGEPLFRIIAGKYFHLGPNGAGSTMKLVVNAILGTEMQAIAEAAALGERSGLNRSVLLDVLSQTAVIAPAHLGKLGRAAADDFGPQFPLRLMNKDFRLILELARSEDARMPAAEAAFQVNNSALHNDGDKDFSIVMRHMEMRDEESRVAKTVLEQLSQRIARGMSMITVQKQPLVIEDLGKHPPEDIAEVCMLLEAGVVGQPDSHRPNFFELDGLEHVYYIFGIRRDRKCC